MLEVLPARRLEDGERVAAADGVVVAEAAETAAWMHAVLVSCGACRRGDATAQVRFYEPELFGDRMLRDESSSSERDDDAELRAYNEMLREMSRSDRRG